MVALVTAQQRLTTSELLTENPARQPFSTKVTVTLSATSEQPTIISVAPETQTNQKLGGITTITAINGVATFTDLTFYRNESNVKLIFKCDSCEEGKIDKLFSNAFTITPALRNLGVQYPKPSNLFYEHPVVAGQVSFEWVWLCHAYIRFLPLRPVAALQGFIYVF